MSKHAPLTKRCLTTCCSAVPVQQVPTKRPSPSSRFGSVPQGTVVHAGPAVAAAGGLIESTVAAAVAGSGWAEAVATAAAAAGG